ncbi:RNA polymerase sigma factor RpoE [Candidatus Vallotia cooleyia]|uniref:RNA polymerase sigma factor RpoE n=1 Tax=Candidatus Vallotiella adelgis TaxID=1177211 RepID=UPI001D01EC1F|nr:RNA polymerase sigma factor RpoE [Candidatus Vallotia cooleyia]UDG82040.1 ECF RNA polymerase sigma-E factor [Candidatus Vallotia cooleyia]
MSEKEIDQALVERVQKGDKAAFELLVTKYHRKIIRLISRLVRDSAEVEDVAQDAFIKAYRALRQFRSESTFYTWLYRIAINTAKNYLATQGRHTSTSRHADIETVKTCLDVKHLKDVNTPELVLMSKQIAHTVNTAMALLPDELRIAITLREIEGLSYEEIADTMSCPIGTVRSRIFRAREVIATKLRPLLDTPAGKRW